MESKLEIAKNWLPRYTGMPLNQFGDYILVTNFKNYVEKFSKRFDVEIYGEGKAKVCWTRNFAPFSIRKRFSPAIGMMSD